MKQFFLAICAMVSFCAIAHEVKIHWHPYYAEPNVPRTEEQMKAIPELWEGLTADRMFEDMKTAWNWSLDSIAGGRKTADGNGVILAWNDGKEYTLAYINVDEMKKIWKGSHFIPVPGDSVTTVAWSESKSYIKTKRRIKRHVDGKTERFLGESVGNYYGIAALKEIYFPIQSNFCGNSNVNPVITRETSVDDEPVNSSSAEKKVVTSEKQVTNVTNNNVYVTNPEPQSQQGVVYMPTPTMNAGGCGTCGNQNFSGNSLVDFGLYGLSAGLRIGLSGSLTYGEQYPYGNGAYGQCGGFGYGQYGYGPNYGMAAYGYGPNYGYSQPGNTVINNTSYYNNTTISNSNNTTTSTTNPRGDHGLLPVGGYNYGSPSGSPGPGNQNHGGPSGAPGNNTVAGTGTIGNGGFSGAPRVGQTPKTQPSAFAMLMQSNAPSASKTPQRSNFTNSVAMQTGKRNQTLDPGNIRATSKFSDMVASQASGKRGSGESNFARAVTKSNANSGRNSGQSGQGRGSNAENYNRHQNQSRNSNSGNRQQDRPKSGTALGNFLRGGRPPGNSGGNNGYGGNRGVSYNNSGRGSGGGVRNMGGGGRAPSGGGGHSTGGGHRR